MDEMPRFGGGDAKGDTEVVRQRKRVRISCSIIESEQGTHRVDASQRPTKDPPLTTVEAGDDIGRMGEDDGRDVVVRTEVAGGAQLTPPRQK